MIAALAAALAIAIPAPDPPPQACMLGWCPIGRVTVTANVVGPLRLPHLPGWWDCRITGDPFTVCWRVR